MLWGERTGAQEKCDKREDHLVPKFLVEEKHPKHDPYWYKAQDWHGVLDNLQDSTEFLDVCRELVDQLAGKAIRPKALLALAKRDLELDVLVLMAVFLEIVQCVLESGRSPLNTVVHP